MTTLNNLTGNRFGKLTVIERCDNYTYVVWKCLCDCGKTVEVRAACLTRLKTRSCGCYRRDMGIKRGKDSAKHGEGSNGKETAEYRVWCSMLSRCNNINHKIYKHYGARGISVCPEWFSYENFLSDMGRRPSNGHSIDRIDVNGNYCKENCRWADIKTQNRNTTRNKYITVEGETKCISEWIEYLSFDRKEYQKCVDKGESPEEFIKRKLAKFADFDWDNMLSG